MASRDVLAELDSVEQYLRDLIGSDPAPGHDANLAAMDSVFARARDLTQNTVELAAEYGSGVTHEQRVANSMGVKPADAEAQAKIADLEAQVAALKAGASDG